MLICGGKDYSFPPAFAASVPTPLLAHFTTRENQEHYHNAVLSTALAAAEGPRLPKRVWRARGARWEGRLRFHVLAPQVCSLCSPQ